MSWFNRKKRDNKKEEEGPVKTGVSPVKTGEGPVKTGVSLCLRPCRKILFDVAADSDCPVKICPEGKARNIGPFEMYIFCAELTVPRDASYEEIFELLNDAGAGLPERLESFYQYVDFDGLQVPDPREIPMLEFDDHVHIHIRNWPMRRRRGRDDFAVLYGCPTAPDKAGIVHPSCLTEFEGFEKAEF